MAKNFRNRTLFLFFLSHLVAFMSTVSGECLDEGPWCSQYAHRCADSAFRTYCHLTCGVCTTTITSSTTAQAVITACPSETFGASCDRQCHCRDNSRCDQVTGVCPGGQCAAGWTDNHCQSPCARGSFGPSCGGACHCSNNSCDHVAGTCSEGGCETGWTGDACQQDTASVTDESITSRDHQDGRSPLPPAGLSPESTCLGAAISGGLGGLAFIVLLVVVLIIVNSKRRSQSTESDGNQEVEYVNITSNDQEADGSCQSPMDHDEKDEDVYDEIALPEPSEDMYTVPSISAGSPAPDCYDVLVPAPIADVTVL